MVDDDATNAPWPLFAHGTKWETGRVQWLLDAWAAGHSVEACAKRLGRTRLSIVCKLATAEGGRNTSHLDNQRRETWYNPNKERTPTLIEKEEIKMSKFNKINSLLKEVYTITKSLTLEDYLSEIATKEAELAALNVINNKPKTLATKAKEIQDEIDALVAKCDAQLGKG